MNEWLGVISFYLVVNVTFLTLLEEHLLRTIVVNPNRAHVF
jgi:hypothetical protein